MMHSFQVELGESVSRIESKIDQTTSHLRDWIEIQKKSEDSSSEQHNQMLRKGNDHLPPTQEEESFDIFQDIGSRARILVTCCRVCI